MSEALDVDTSKIEEKLIEDQSKDLDAQDPTQAAAMMYGLYAPKFLQGVKMLSSRGRTRVLKALIEYPLNEKEYKHSSQLEKEMMSIGHAVLEAKFLMILSTMYNNIEELQDAADPSIPADLTDEEKAELEAFMSAGSVEKGLEASKELKLKEA